MENYIQDGYNDGYGRRYLNNGHDQPMSDEDLYFYNKGYEEGRRRKEIADEIDEELYGDED